MKNYKVLLLVLLICISLVAISACAPSSENDIAVNEGESTGDVSKNETTAPDKASEDGSTDTESSTDSDVTVEEQVLLEKDGIKIILKSLEADGLFGSALKVLIENSSDKSVTVQTRDAAINGVMIEGSFSRDVVTGKNANSEISFMQSDLDTAGIETIKDIEFKFMVLDTETFDVIFDSETINITTSADPSFVQTYDNSGFVALDQNGFKVTVKKLESEDSFWGADIYVYIENNGETNATVQVRDVSVNGFMIEPAFSSDILAGKKAYDTITFLESDLTDNDITSIDEIELAFHIFDAASFDTIFESEVVKVSFGE